MLSYVTIAYVYFTFSRVRDWRVKRSFNDNSVFPTAVPVVGSSFLFPRFTDGAAINPVSMLSRITVCPNKRERLGRFSPIEFHRKPADHDRRRFATRRVPPPLPPFILSLPRFLRNPVFFPSCIDALRNASWHFGIGQRTGVIAFFSLFCLF